MTPTSEERREVAETLMQMAEEHSAVEASRVAHVLGLEYEVHGTVVAFGSDDVQLLADLIDTTCLAVHQGTSMDDELVCSRCGASLGAEVGGRQMFVPNFCSCCGARVESRDEQ